MTDWLLIGAGMLVGAAMFSAAPLCEWLERRRIAKTGYQPLGPAGTDLGTPPTGGSNVMPPPPWCNTLATLSGDVQGAPRPDSRPHEGGYQPREPATLGTSPTGGSAIMPPRFIPGGHPTWVIAPDRVERIPGKPNTYRITFGPQPDPWGNT